MSKALLAAAAIAVALVAAAPSSAGGGNVYTVTPLVSDQFPLVGPVDNQDAAPFAGRKPAIVQVIAIHRHERAPELLREAIVLQVGRAAQPFFFEHEEDVPLQASPHVGHEPCGHVGVGVNARPRREAFGVWG